MSAGFAARFVLEVVFLALLALAAGLADLGTGWIVGLMVVGWLLVTLVEWLAWRSEVGVEPRLVAQGESQDEAAEETTGWDIEEILAPAPEPEAQSQEEGAAS